MTATLLRRIKDRMYSIAPSGDDYYAFWADGRAGLYIDGTFVSYRSTTGPTIPEAPSLIHTDSEAIVGAGSIAFRVDSENLRVWDVAGDVTYDYAVPAGYVTTPPIYADGYLWWIEREAVQHGGGGAHKTYFRLRKARTDLTTNLATVYTYEAVHYIGFSVAWDFYSQMGLALTAAGAIAQASWGDNVSGEVADEINVRIERDGGGATDSGWPTIAPTGTNVDQWVFVTAPPTAAGLAAAAVSAGFLAGQADDAEASPVAFWSGAEWAIGSCANTSVSADGSEGSLFDSTQLVRGPAAAGTPTNKFTVGVSPADDTPAYFFIKG